MAFTAAIRARLTPGWLPQVFGLNWLRDRRRAELVQPVLLSGGQLMVAASLAITAAVDTEHTAAKDLNATQATSAPPPATLLLGTAPSLDRETPQPVAGHGAAPPAAQRDTAPPRPTVVPLPTVTAPITGNRIHQDAYHDPDYDIGLAVPTPQGDRRSGIQIQDEQDHRPFHEALCLAADTAPIAYCDR